MKTKTTTWLAQIVAVALMLAAGSASASNGLLSGNSPLGKNTLEGALHRASASVSGETHRGCVEVSRWDAAELFVAPVRLPGFTKTWAEMTQAERAAFQHAFDRHGAELGLPRWTHGNAEALRVQYNAAVTAIRQQAQSVTTRTMSFGVRGSGQQGQGVTVRWYEYTNPDGVRFYYAETLDGTFVSSGLVQ